MAEPTTVQCTVYYSFICLVGIAEPTTVQCAVYCTSICLAGIVEPTMVHGTLYCTIICLTGLTEPTTVHCTVYCTSICLTGMYSVQCTVLLFFKLVWQNLLLYMALYFSLSILYRFGLNEPGKVINYVKSED